ncbi:MAG: hypothetical protein ABI634_01810 [Acidobacteriota bacterium]
MMRQRTSLISLFVLPLCALTSVALVCRVQAAQSTQATRPPQSAQATAAATERFTATAVNMSAAGAAPATTPVSIVISRWSTDAERDALVNALREKGPDAVLDKLKDMPRAGSIAAAGSIGQEIHFARRVLGPNNTERVVLITDRPMSIWEMRSGSRTLDYPFTLVELRVGSDGKGEGKASVATKVIFDKDSNNVVLENYDIQPIGLQNVTREK